MIPDGAWWDPKRPPSLIVGRSQEDQSDRGTDVAVSKQLTKCPSVN